MLRKIAILLAMTVAVVVTGVPGTATAATTATTAPPAPVQVTAGPSRASTWLIEGTFATYFECDDRGSFGELNGWWLSYYCEYDPFANNYRLWVEQPGNPRVCQTDAHAYVVYNGGVYFSGYEGSTSQGIPTLSVGSGTRVTLGGNGIKPNTTVTFRFYNANTNAEVGSGSSRTSSGKCVANENAFTLNFGAGLYLAKATYTSGNSQQTYTSHLETYIQLS
jgi:hypothetical protein